MSKQYDERNAMALGDYYGRHCHAMTVESLHAKSDIAAELAYRDKRIDELLAAMEEKDQRIKELSSALTIEKGASAFESRRTTHIDRMRDKFLKRAEAAEQREGNLKSDVDVLSARNAELERANAAQDDHINQQQDRIDSLEKRNGELGKYAGKLEQRLQPLNFETSAEELLAHCLKAGEISGDKQQVRIKELIGWFSRYYQHAANPKWLSGHAAELCYFIIKNSQAEQRLQQPIKLPEPIGWTPPSGRAVLLKSEVIEAIRAAGGEVVKP